jgi:hypothetical protein
MSHKKDLLLGSEQWRDRALYQFPFFQWFSLDGSTRWHELFGAHEIVMYMLNLSSLLKVQGHSQGFCSAVECRNCSAVAARGETEDRVSVDFAVAKGVRPREEEKLEIATSTIVMTKSYLFSIVLKYFYGAALAESSQVDMDGLFVCVSMQTGLPKFSSNTRLLHASEWNPTFSSGR